MNIKQVRRILVPLLLCAVTTTLATETVTSDDFSWVRGETMCRRMPVRMSSRGTSLMQE